MAETSRYGRTRVTKIRAAYNDMRTAVQAGDIECAYLDGYRPADWPDDWPDTHPASASA